ncbi:hypothetical protein ACFQ0M_25315 [Kitasatospora aburaviensis]
MRPRSLALAAAFAVLPLSAVSLGVTTAQAATTPNAAAPRVALPETVTPPWPAPRRRVTSRPTSSSRSRSA